MDKRQFLLILFSGFLVFLAEPSFAQKKFNIFLGVYNDTLERINELKKQGIEGEVIGHFESVDHRWRLSTLNVIDGNQYAILQWIYDGNCKSQLFEGKWAGNLLESISLFDSTCESYLLHFEVNRDGELFHTLSWIKILPDTAFLEVINLYAPNGNMLSQGDFLEIKLGNLTENDFNDSEEVKLIKNGIHLKSINLVSNKPIFKTKNLVSYQSIYLVRTSDYLVDNANNFMEDPNSVEANYFPPLGSITPDTLLVRKSLIGNEVITTTILTGYQEVGCMGEPELQDRVIAKYMFRGQEFFSSTYDLENRVDSQDWLDPKWGIYKLFEPDYCKLTDGSVVFRTFSLQNDMRPGMCGACDYMNEAFIQVKGRKKFELFAAYYNLGNGGARFSNTTNLNDIEMEDGLTYTETTNINHKFWKIYFGSDQNETIENLLYYELKFLPKKDQAAVNMVKRNNESQNKNQ